jgi:hypothetical protein
MQKQMTEKFQGSVIFDCVYFIECSQEDAPHIRHSIAPLAIRPLIKVEMHQATWGTNSWRGEYISWDDVNPKIDSFVRQADKQGDEPIFVKESPDKIIFTKDTHVLTLVKLTLKLFDQKVRPIVAGGGTLTFANDEEVQKFFLTASFER